MDAEEQGHFELLFLEGGVELQHEHAGQEEEREGNGDDELYFGGPLHSNINQIKIIHHSVARLAFFLYLSLIRTALTTFRGPWASLGWFMILSLANRRVDPPPSKFMALKQFKLCITCAISDI